MKIEAVIFDLDRTLLNLKVSEEVGLRQLLQQLDVSLDFKLFYQTYTKINEYWWEQRSEGKASSIEVKENRFRDTFDHFKIDTKLNFSQINDQYFSFACKEWTLYPHVDQQLKKLRLSGIKLAIITNGFTQTQQKKIKHLDINNYFDFICLSEEVGYIKPDSRIFHHTCDQLNVEPSRSVYIGDDYKTDIIGALNASLKAIWFNEHGLDNPRNVAEFNSFKQFDSVLKNVLQ